MSRLAREWQKRIAITIDNTAGASSADIDVTIPTWFDAFWSAIDSSGNELRVTHANGVTLATYDVDDGTGGSFDRSAKKGRIRIKTFAMENTASMVLAWLYFDSSSTQGSAASSAGAGGADGYIALEAPSQNVLTYGSQRPGLSRPRKIRTKGTNEALHFWFNVSTVLERSVVQANGSPRQFEEPWLLTEAIYNSSGTDVSTSASMGDLAEARFVSDRQGRVWVKVVAKNGTDGQNYTVAPQIRTVVPRASAPNTQYRRIEPRAGLAVEDVLQT